LSQNSANIFERATVFPDRIDVAQPITPDNGQQFLFPPTLEDRVPTDQLVPLIQQARENLGLAAADTLTVADGSYDGTPACKPPSNTRCLSWCRPPKGETIPAIPTPSDIFSTTRPPGPSPVRNAGRSLTKARPPNKACRWNAIAATCATVRCGRKARAPPGRALEVRPSTPQVQAMRARLAEPDGPAQWARRRVIIEPRFGQIKPHEGFRRWTVWGVGQREDPMGIVAVRDVETAGAPPALAPQAQAGRGERGGCRVAPKPGPPSHPEESLARLR